MSPARILFLLLSASVALSLALGATGYAVLLCILLACTLLVSALPDEPGAAAAPARAPVRRRRAVIATCLLVPALAWGGALALEDYQSGGRVDLTVTNHATAPATVTLLRDDQTRIVGVDALAPGRSHRSSYVAGHVSRYTLRVTVGATTFTEEAGPLLDDDGPHGFSIDVRDGRVVVTKSNNEGPYTHELPPVSASANDR